jgi:hypothetical protein
MQSSDNDLFHPENRHLIPELVFNVLETHDENADQYEELARLVRGVEMLGYTFDYYLDAQPFDLRKINEPTNYPD